MNTPNRSGTSFYNNNNGFNFAEVDNNFSSSKVNKKNIIAEVNQNYNPSGFLIDVEVPATHQEKQQPMDQNAILGQIDFGMNEGNNSQEVFKHNQNILGNIGSPFGDEPVQNQNQNFNQNQGFMMGQNNMMNQGMPMGQSNLNVNPYQQQPSFIDQGQVFVIFYF